MPNGLDFGAIFLSFEQKSGKIIHHAGVGVGGCGLMQGDSYLELNVLESEGCGYIVGSSLEVFYNLQK